MNLWQKAKKSWTVYSAAIIAVLGVIQTNIMAFELSPSDQGKALMIIGILTALARLRPKSDE